MSTQPLVTEVVWSGTGPDCRSVVQVRRLPTGFWHVTYAGLVWATSDRLRAALGDACSVSKEEPWTIATERTILADPGCGPDRS
jgi:hypothetical protein